MTDSKRWFRVQGIGEIIRPDPMSPDAYVDPAEPVIIRIDPRWEDGLRGIDDFSHLVVLFYLDRAERRRVAGEPMKPEGRDELAPVGFFSTRTPRRPNPIGINCPRLLRRDGCDLHVTGLDGWNGTPVLDIKGYFPRDEQRPDATIPTWLSALWAHHDDERAVQTLPSTESEIAMPKPGTLVARHENRAGMVTFRYPRACDAESGHAFVNALSAELTFVLFQGEHVTMDEEREWLDGRIALLREGKGVTVCAFSGDRYMGAAQIDLGAMVSKHVGYFGIAIAPELRGLGVGTLLMEAAIAEAEKHLRGMRMIQLDVYANNVRGIHLYRKLGFTEYARLPGAVLHRGEYVDLVSMYRKVPRSAQ